MKNQIIKNTGSDSGCCGDDCCSSLDEDKEPK